MMASFKFGTRIEEEDIAKLLFLSTKPGSLHLLTCIAFAALLGFALIGDAVRGLFDENRAKRTYEGKSSEWMLGRTPPWEMTTEPRRRLSSSSFRMARDGELQVTGNDTGLLVVTGPLPPFCIQAPISFTSTSSQAHTHRTR
jgi:hypothetical protein